MTEFRVWIPDYHHTLDHEDARTLSAATPAEAVVAYVEQFDASWQVYPTERWVRVRNLSTKEEWRFLVNTQLVAQYRVTEAP